MHWFTGAVRTSVIIAAWVVIIVSFLILLLVAPNFINHSGCETRIVDASNTSDLKNISRFEILRETCWNSVGILHTSSEQLYISVDQGSSTRYRIETDAPEINPVRHDIDGKTILEIKSKSISGELHRKIAGREFLFRYTAP